MEKSGKWIVLEAVDDVALDRLSLSLCRWMRQYGLPVEQTREPTNGPAGTQILLARQGRLELDATSLALLYLADRLDHFQHADGIESRLCAGRHVICAHYELTAAAWLWGQIDHDWLRRINVLSRVPDLTLFVDLPAHGSQQRQLRKGYLASIEHLVNKRPKAVIVETTHRLEDMQLSCQRHIARLLEIKLPGLDRGAAS